MDDLWDIVQDAKIQGLNERLDNQQAHQGVRQQTYDVDLRVAALIRLLIKKQLITADELTAEMRAIESELIGRIKS